MKHLTRTMAAAALLGAAAYSLTPERLELKDSSGRTRVVVGDLADPVGYGIAVRDEQGTSRIVVAVQDDGSAVIKLLGEHGEPAFLCEARGRKTTVRIGGQQNATLETDDLAGTMSLSAENGKGNKVLNVQSDAAGVFRAKLGGNDMAAAELTSGSDSITAGLSCGGKQNVLVEARRGEHCGISVATESGKVVMASDKGVGTSLTLVDKDGAPGILLQHTTEDGTGIHILRPKAKSGIAIGINAEGKLVDKVTSESGVDTERKKQ